MHCFSWKEPAHWSDSFRNQTTLITLYAYERFTKKSRLITTLTTLVTQHTYDQLIKIVRLLWTQGLFRSVVSVAMLQQHWINSTGESIRLFYIVGRPLVGIINRTSIIFLMTQYLNKMKIISRSIAFHSLLAHLGPSLVLLLW